MIDALETRFPQIPWRQPTTIRVVGLDEPRFGCRICIARYGLKAREIDVVPYCFKERADHLAHLQAQHQ